MGGQAYRWQTQQSEHALQETKAGPGAEPKPGEARVSDGQPVKWGVGTVGTVVRAGGGCHYRSNAPSTLP